MDGWRRQVAERERDGRDKLSAEAASDDSPVSHYRLAAEIAKVVTPDTIVIGRGSGSIRARSAVSAWGRRSRSPPSCFVPTSACC